MAVAFGPRVTAEDLILCIDPANQKSWSYNIHPTPINIYSWVTTGNSCVLSRDPTVTDSPVNGTPLKMVVTASDPHIFTTNTYLNPAASGQTWTVSVYAKASTNTAGELYILGLNSANTWIEAPNQGINITTSWQRFSYTATFANALTTGIAIRLDGPNSGYASDGNTVPTIWWDGLQVERNSSATRFNSVTNSNRTSIYELGLLKNHCTLNGAASHNRANNPNTFDTNATQTTDQNYINTPTINLVDRSGFTFDFWVKLRPSAPVTYHTLAGEFLAAPFLFVYANNTTGDNWYVGFRDTGTSFRNFSAITDWNIQNNWTNIILTFNASGHISFYLNGNLIQTITNSISTALGVKAIMGGYNAAGTYYPFQGSLGMAKLYSRTLSASDVKGSFASARGRFGV